MFVLRTRRGVCYAFEFELCETAGVVGVVFAECEGSFICRNIILRQDHRGDEGEGVGVGHVINFETPRETVYSGIIVYSLLCVITIQRVHFAHHVGLFKRTTFGPCSITELVYAFVRILRNSVDFCFYIIDTKRLMKKKKKRSIFFYNKER